VDYIIFLLTIRQQTPIQHSVAILQVCIFGHFGFDKKTIRPIQLRVVVCRCFQSWFNVPDRVTDSDWAVLYRTGASRLRVMEEFPWQVNTDVDDGRNLSISVNR